MKKNTYILAIILVFTSLGALHAQSPRGKWEYTKIKIDSLMPLRLVALDSLHCLLNGYSLYNFERNFEPLTSNKAYWLRTSDGGRTWLPIDFSGLDFMDSVIYRGFGVPYPFYYDTPLLTPGGKVAYLSTLGRKSDTNSSLNKYRILVTTDFGEHWAKQYFPIDTGTYMPTFHIVSAPGGNNLYAYDSDNQKDNPRRGRLLYSSNYGAKFNPLPNDNVFQDALDPQCDTFFREGANISVQHSDLLHVSARILPAFNGCDSLAQRGLTTLVSSNGGGSWEKHHYELPGYEKEYLFGDLQYIKATPHLYCFNNGHINDNGYRYEGALNESWNRGGQGFYSSGGDSYFNTSYLYSSDYGATWTPEHAYGNRRRAYEAVAKDEVWMTVSRQDDIHVLGRKASVIVQTTDNGKSWHEDKLTMNESDIGEFDGRIISFSDPKHGWIAATKDGQTYVFRYTANTPSGVEADDDTDPANATFRIKAYPNPATETMNILLPKFQTITKIEVYDMLGRQRPVDVTMNANTAAISTHELSAGCYIARTTTLRGTRLMTSFAVMR